MSTNNNTTQSKNTSRHIIGILSIIIAICCGSVSSAWAQPPVSGDIIPGEYIVAFKKTDPPATPTAIRALAESLVVTYGGQMLYVYEYAAPGFAAKLSARAVSVLQQDSRIDFIEPNRVIQLDPVTASADQAKLQVPAQPQSVYSWGLDRIDQRGLPLDGNYGFTLNGDKVRVYILDTGIRLTHEDFGSRAIEGIDAIDGALPTYTCPVATPFSSHGTHVAGTVGGTKYGVAKGVTLVSVRVMDCNGGGSTATVMAGIDYVTQQKQSAPWIPAVANMSLRFLVPDQAVDNAVRDSIVAGVTYAIAAGNEGQDASKVSPARVETAITVGATAANDKRADFPGVWASNIGGSVSIFAPGVDITSAWSGDDKASYAMSGTSMATPHVAGVAAIYLQSNKTATPADVKSVILGRATLDVVTNIGLNSPNLLLYSGVPYYKNYPLTYRAYTDTTPGGSAWQSWVTSPNIAGTTGQSLPMKALQVFLPTNSPPNMRLDYRSNIANAWSLWATGTVTGTPLLNALPLEAVQMKLTLPPSPGCKVRYRAHVAYLGWLPWVDGYKMTGTIGQARRMEAIQMICTCP